MTAAPAIMGRTFTAHRWVWPIDITRYDRSPDLTAAERLAIRALLKQDMHGRYRRGPRGTSLGGRLDPIIDALKLTGASKTDAGLVIKLVLRHMQRCGCSFWKWTESDWGDIVHNTIAGFERRNIASARSRPYLMAVCVLLGRISDLRHLGNFD